MQVELGNDFPVRVDHDGFPRVTYVSVPDTYSYVAAYDDGATQTIGRDRQVNVTTAVELANETAAHLGRSVDGVTHMPDQEALLSVIGAWRSESEGKPSWVWSDNDDFGVLLGAFFDCPVGRPANVEASHHTNAGPPGVAGRDAEADAAVAVANEPSEAE